MCNPSPRSVPGYYRDYIFPLAIQLLRFFIPCLESLSVIMRVRLNIKLSLLLCGLVLIVILAAGCAGDKEEQMAEDGDRVAVHYTGTLVDGSVFDSSRGRDPLEFVLGAGNMIPGFENAVRGMKIGEVKTVTLSPEEAYGPFREDLIIKISREELPEDLNPEVGQKLTMTQQDGRSVEVTVTEVSDTDITVDANFFLAGKELTFEIELVKIEPAD